MTQLDTVARQAGLQDTKSRILDAAEALFVEGGFESLSMRQITNSAGVNLAAVNYHFGGKDALLQAAMQHLVHEHHAYAMEQSRRQPLPAPFALLGDPTYLRAVVRAVLDNEMSLARTELTEDVSVPRNAMKHLVRERGDDEPTVELKAKVGLAMAMEMGWAALEPFILSVVDAATPEEQEQVRVEARRVRNRLVTEMVDDDA